MAGRPSNLSPASGDEVRFVGSAMAGVVQAVDSVAELIGERPVVVGGLAVMCPSACHIGQQPIWTLSTEAGQGVSPLSRFSDPAKGQKMHLPLEP